MYNTSLHGTLVVAALCCTGVAAAADPVVAPVNVDLLEQKVDSMSKELDELKAQLRQLKAQGAAPGAPQAAGAAPEAAQIKTAPESYAATAGAAPPKQPESTATAGLSRWDKISLWGYGEIYYTHPTTDSSQTQADLARAVFGIGYRSSTTDEL